MHSMLHTQGHAIECRVYAEDPANNFFPCTGTLLLWEQAKLPPSLVRFDTGIVSGTDLLLPLRLSFHHRGL